VSNPFPSNDESSEPTLDSPRRLRFDAPAGSVRAGGERPPDHERFQFGLRSMFVLTAACAVILGLTSMLETPLVFRIVAASYFILLAAYAVLRLPSILRRIRWAIARRKELQQEREQIAQSLARAISARAESAGDGRRDDGEVG
jgi:hypothetical protein